MINKYKNHNIYIKNRCGTDDLAVYQEYYIGNTTHIISNRTVSDAIKIRVGVKQGDPLSPLLFNCVIKYITDGLSKRIGVSVGTETVNHLSFADDLVLMANTTVGLQRAIDDVVRRMKNCGLSVNSAMCASFSIIVSGKQHKWACDNKIKFRIQGDDLPSLNINESYKYLGIDISVGKSNTAKIRDDLIQKVGFTTNARLKPQQRIDILNNHLYHKYLHRLTFTNITDNLLRYLDIIVRGAVRGWLRLHKDTSLGVFYSQHSLGGLNMKSFRYHLRMNKNKRLNKLKDSDDRVLRASTELLTLATVFKPIQLEGIVVRSANQMNTAFGSRLLNSIDGRGLAGSDFFPFTNLWIGSGSEVMNGHNYVDAFKIKHSLIMTKTRLSRMYKDRPITCDAYGCGKRETISHILQSCLYPSA